MKEKERVEKLLQLVAGTRVGRGEKGNKIKEEKKKQILTWKKETWKKRGSVVTLVSLNADLDMASRRRSITWSTIINVNKASHYSCFLIDRKRNEHESEPIKERGAAYAVRG